MDFLEIFNLIASACSIIGLIVTLIVASKVTKLKNSNNHNSGQIQQGDGEQNVATGHSVVGDGTSIHNDYRNAKIIGEVDEPPILTENEYYIYSDKSDKYALGISNQTCEMIDIGMSNIIVFNADFSNVASSPSETRFIGFSFKSLPMNDWRSFILKNYCFAFTYSCTDNIKEIWIENCIGQKGCVHIANPRIYKK